MTFSIVARGADGTSFGVAVASKFLAVGAAVPAAEAGIGAIATQSYANLAYRPDGLAQLREGRIAQLILDTLVAADEQRETRQAGIVDAAGTAATFTGSECNPWAGGTTGDGYAIQGNILVGPEVVDAMEEAWLSSHHDEPLARRLLAVLTAGDATGGDRRGRQSAALLVVTPDGGYGGGSDVLVDLRVDDHATPVQELARLLELHDLYFGKPDPDALLDLDGELATEVRALLGERGFTDDDLGAALVRWAGVENYEERLVPDKIDPLVLEQLRRAVVRPDKSVARHDVPHDHDTSSG
jgi:uncharacterized Ntn-hydrolase superfamily protein